MGQVPDKAAFSLFDVLDAVYGSHASGNLADAFADSDAAKFDPAYGSKTMSPQALLGFRNYGAVTGYDDWYLPSRTELPLMYNYLYMYYVGDFSPTNYWSSTEVPEVPLPKTKAYGRHFGYNGEEEELLKVNSYHVRAMRMFTLPTNSYALRDEGPAGGLIFYKEVLSGDPDPSIMYYEAAPSDQSAGTYWTNAITICNNLVIYH